MKPTLSVTLIMTLIIATGIAAGTLSAPGQGGGVLPLSDKQMHALAFMVLVLPLGWVAPRWAMWVGLAAFGFGALIEVLQPLVGRSAEWADLLADGVGIVAGLVPGVLRHVLSRRMIKEKARPEV